ncbi:ABC transporter permease [Campylobacter concisus]|uniref:ABC transporter permease n=1 Tax=Campylobacter concisus TaxID=199 RepID=UPI0018AB5720|nr:ABC transporter permease [Campylobacter concisus]QPI00181.1 ABC transporter permease [Campylobacter concisus]QPI01971.1 ABC transporter permease [Campylobacter concisus]
MIEIFKKSVLILAIFALWQVVCELKIFTPYILPSPITTLKTMLDMSLSGELIMHVIISFKRIFIGYILAFVLAFIFGGVAALFPKASIYYEWILEFFRNVPPLSLIAILVLWFGINETPKIIIIILASFFPMFLSISKGLTSCDVKLIEVGKIFCFSKFEIFYKIILKNAIKDIFVGMRIGFGYAMRAIVGAEMIAASSGLGYLILDAEELSRADRIFVGIFTIGICGVLIDRIFLFLISKFSLLRSEK